MCLLIECFYARHAEAELGPCTTAAPTTPNVIAFVSDIDRSRALVPRQRWPCGSIKTGHCRTTRQSGHGDDAKPGRRDVDFFRRSEPLLARCADDRLLA